MATQYGNWYMTPKPDYDPRGTIGQSGDELPVMAVNMQVISIFRYDNEPWYKLIITDTLREILGSYGAKEFVAPTASIDLYLKRSDKLLYDETIQINIPWEIRGIYRSEEKKGAYVYALLLKPPVELESFIDQTEFEILAQGVDHWLGLFTDEELPDWFGGE